MKEHTLSIPVVFGSGYVSTELRFLRDPRIFESSDYLVLDDGEAPLLAILATLAGRKIFLIRTMQRSGNSVRFTKGSINRDLWGTDLGTPRYERAELERYLGLAETPNPMQRLWSKRNTLKLRLTHGYYWHRCAFCDTTLPHITCYRALDPALVAAQAKRSSRRPAVAFFISSTRRSPQCSSDASRKK